LNTGYKERSTKFHTLRGQFVAIDNTEEELQRQMQTVRAFIGVTHMEF